MITLTDKFGIKFRLNPKAIICYEPYEETSFKTMIEVFSGRHLWVRETVSEIDQLIKENKH